MKRVPPLPVEYSLLFEIDPSSDIAGHTINEAVPGMHSPNLSADDDSMSRTKVANALGKFEFALQRIDHRRCEPIAMRDRARLLIRL